MSRFQNCCFSGLLLATLIAAGCSQSPTAPTTDASTLPERPPRSLVWGVTPGRVLSDDVSKRFSSGGHNSPCGCGFTSVGKGPCGGQQPPSGNRRVGALRSVQVEGCISDNRHQGRRRAKRPVRGWLGTLGAMDRRRAQSEDW